MDMATDVQRMGKILQKNIVVGMQELTGLLI